MSVNILLTIPVQPEKLDEFLQLIREIAPDTRAYEGCIGFDIYIDQDNPGTVLFFEEWESKQHYENYGKWRQETGLLETLAPLLAGLPSPSYVEKFDG